MKSRGLLWALVMIAAVFSDRADAHHVFGKPHFTVLEGRSEPTMSLLEEVGGWQLEVFHHPGHPIPDLPAQIVLRSKGTEPIDGRTPISMTVRRLRVSASSSEPIEIAPLIVTDGEIRGTIHYPADGNYLVTIQIGEGDEPDTLAFHVVVGTPGSPFLIAGSFALALLFCMLLLRSIAIRRARQGTPDA